MLGPVRLRVCACVCESVTLCVCVCVCVCVSIGVMGDFKDIGEDKYSLSITTVQEVFFKAVLVQTFCHICFQFHFLRRVLFSMQMYYFLRNAIVL